MSEHEGFMVPIIEAFAAGCPVIALKAAAVPGTMGGAGILLNENEPSTIAGLLYLLKTQPDLRQSIVRQQARRAGDFDARNTYRLWAEKLRLKAVHRGVVR
jgi:glycosyltransferase involved in cell wall biosynthesis